MKRLLSFLIVKSLAINTEKNRRFSFLLFYQLFFLTFLYGQSGHIIISGQHSRLGDTITAYTMAQWLSYKYNLDFRMVPFKGSASFSFDQVHAFLSDEESAGKDIIELESESDLIDFMLSDKKPALLLVTHSTVIQYPSALIEKMSWPDLYTSLFYYLDQHPVVGSAVMNAVQLRETPKEASLDPATISVAVHVRSGSGPDTDSVSVQYRDEWEAIQKQGIARAQIPYATDLHFPLKLPPEQFYADQINKLSYLLGNLPLTVYIFTDNKEPEKVIDRLKKRILSPFVSLKLPFTQDKDSELRSASSSAIIDDVYNMSRCDCFIKAESGLALLAQLMGKHAITLHPQCSVMCVDRQLNQVMLDIHDVSVILDEKKGQKKEFLSCNDPDAVMQKKAQKALLATMKEANKSIVPVRTITQKSAEERKNNFCCITLADQDYTKNFAQFIVDYAFAQWYSYKYSVPFMYESRGQDDREETYKTDFFEKFLDKKIDSIKTIFIKNENEFIKTMRSATEPTICMVSHDSSIDCPGELALNFHQPQQEGALYFYLRRHPVFAQTIKNISSQYTYANTSSVSCLLPKEVVTVALVLHKPEHEETVQYKDLWRNGSDEKVIFSNNLEKGARSYPLMYPPEQFYLDQLKKLSDLFADKIFLCCLFCNDPEPQLVVERMKKRLGSKNIFFTCYQDDPHHDLCKNTEEDSEALSKELLAIAQSDCLISSLSLKATAAQLWGEHKLIIYPQNVHLIFSDELKKSMIDVHNTTAICYNKFSGKASYQSFNEFNYNLRQNLAVIFE